MFVLFQITLECIFDRELMMILLQKLEAKETYNPITINIVVSFVAFGNRILQKLFMSFVSSHYYARIHYLRSLKK